MIKPSNQTYFEYRTIYKEWFSFTGNVFGKKIVIQILKREDYGKSITKSNSIDAP